MLVVVRKVEPKKPKILIKIYDPPMCCSSGVCGPNVNSSLVEFTSALKSLLKQGIAVERWNLSQQPQAFAENSQVKEQLTKLGKDAMPLIFINDELKITGRYPKAEELFASHRFLISAQNSEGKAFALPGFCVGCIQLYGLIIGLNRFIVSTQAAKRFTFFIPGEGV